MGKQICFYITKKDAEELVQFAQLHGGVVLNEKEFKTRQVNKFFLKLPDSKLVYMFYQGEKRLNQIESEIIEISFSEPQPSRILDRSSVENHFKKGGFIVVDDSEKYHSLMENLYKNPVYVDNPNYVLNGYEYGRVWFEHQYYDTNGNKIIKNKKMTSLFSKIKKYIQKNYILSLDKGWYIGPDAFKKFVDGLFIPCSGKIIINFPRTQGDGSSVSDNSQKN